MPLAWAKASPAASVEEIKDKEQQCASPEDTAQPQVAGGTDHRQPSESTAECLRRHALAAGLLEQQPSPCAVCSGSGKRGVFGPSGLGVVGFDCPACGGTGKGMEELDASWRAKVIENGWALEKAPPAVRQDRGLVLAAVQSQGMALEYAAPQLRNDRPIVLAAVRQDARALQHASDELKADRIVVLAAVSCFGPALRFSTSQDVLSDEEVVLKAVDNDPDAFRYADASLRGSRDFVLRAVTQTPLALPYATDPLRLDREIVLAAVTRNGRALQHARTLMRSDREVVLAAVAQDGLALRYAMSELRADPGVVAAAVAQNALAAQHARLPEQSPSDFPDTVASPDVPSPAG